jgi:hypothetical protein
MFRGKLLPNHEVASDFNRSGKRPATNLAAIAAEQINTTLVGEVAIRLDSIQDADGTIWTPADGRSCRVEPNPLILVSSR